jgi:hypothetical protein
VNQMMARQRAIVAQADALLEAIITPMAAR